MSGRSQVTARGYPKVRAHKKALVAASFCLALGCVHHRVPISSMLRPPTEIVVPNGDSINIEIVNEDGQPLREAIVTLSCLMETAPGGQAWPESEVCLVKQASDAQGHVVFLHRTAGPYRVRVVCGELRAIWPLRLPRKGSVVLTLHMGERDQSVCPSPVRPLESK
jgi:hypothetical protein